MTGEIAENSRIVVSVSSACKLAVKAWISVRLGPLSALGAVTALGAMIAGSLLAEPTAQKGTVPAVSSAAFPGSAKTVGQQAVHVAVRPVSLAIASRVLHRTASVLRHHAVLYVGRTVVTET